MKPVPSKPAVRIRSIKHDGTRHVHLDKYNGCAATLEQISFSSGPDGGLYCEIKTPDGMLWGCSSDFIEFEDTSLAPQTHKTPVLSTAWLACHYRNQAFYSELESDSP